MNINWKTSAKDAALIKKITQRAMRLYKSYEMREDRQTVEMDITCCHNNAYRLRLKDWLIADDFNFCHDLFGIRNCLNRKTGQLDGLFLPRFAERSES